MTFKPVRTGTHSAQFHWQMSWNGIWWDYYVRLTGRATADIVKIHNARMTQRDGRSFLELHILRSFGRTSQYVVEDSAKGGTKGEHNVTITGSISGGVTEPKPSFVVSEKLATLGLWPPDQDSSWPDETPVLIDLAKQGVPRFTRNIVFEITAKVTTNLGTTEHKAKAAVLLPIITISGISDYYQPTNWERDLIGGASDRALKSANLLGEGYRLPARFEGGRPYGTIYTLSYSASNALSRDLQSAVAPSFRELLQQVRENSYADKVNLLGYSLGGISARVCVAEEIATPQGENVVNSVITLGSPHAGTLWARYAPLIWRGLPAKNVYPLGPWWRATEFDVLTHFLGATLFVSNPQLARLSGFLNSGFTFPIQTRLYLYYSDSYIVFINKDLPGSLAAVTNWPTQLLMDRGDAFITADSQQGIVREPFTSLSEDIPAFKPGLRLGTIVRRRMENETHSSIKANGPVINAIVADFMGDIGK